VKQTRDLPVSCAELESQLGFSLIDLVVAVAILSGLMLIANASLGDRFQSVHPSALALEAALLEARSIATMQQADCTDAGLPTGATVSVAADPKNNAHSIISVYRSRPIPNAGASIYGAKLQTLALPEDAGFPRQTVAASFTVTQKNASTIAVPFTIMIASSGYTSIVAGYAYAPGAPIVSIDPGCSDAGASIEAFSGSERENHPFDCRGATYDASVVL